MNVPAELKYIAPYIQRAQELQERDPIVSYYAQYYAATLAISRGPSNAETKAFLSQLLDKLEQLKAAQAGNEAITNDEAGYAHVEKFALKVFLNADNEDRAGKASKKTAKTFLAASIFLELLKTFGDLDPDVEAKIKYAKWKAADIAKALKEGRTPTPGAPDEAQDKAESIDQPVTGDVAHLPDQPPSSISEFPSPPSNFTAPLPGNADNRQQPPFPEHSPSPPPAPSNVVPPPAPPAQSSESPARTETPVAVPSPTTSSHTAPLSAINAGSIASAQKHAKWAISALNYDDIATARTQLLMALNDIGYNQANNFGY